MKNPLALVFSDLHLNDWTKFNEADARTKSHFRVLATIAIECERLGVPAIFGGDLFHKPNIMAQDLMFYSVDMFRDLGKYKWVCYGIDGNHDMNLVNYLDNPTRGWFSVFSDIYPWMHNLFNNPVKLNGDTMLYGVPYVDHNKDLGDYLKKLRIDTEKNNILVLHTDYPGAMDTDGRPVNSSENLPMRALNKFDLILCGHIHKPQKLNNKTYMIGAPLQQRRTDKDCKLGYWVLYDDLSMEFKELKGYPKFIDVESSDDIENDGNYYTVIPPKARESAVSEHKITKQITNKTLVRRYMKVKGLKDKDKKKLLLEIINQAQKDNL